MRRSDRGLCGIAEVVFNDFIEPLHLFRDPAGDQIKFKEKGPRRPNILNGAGRLIMTNARHRISDKRFSLALDLEERRK